jgi:hypothetical protein
LLLLLWPLLNLDFGNRFGQSCHQFKSIGSWKISSKFFSGENFDSFLASTYINVFFEKVQIKCLANLQLICCIVTCHEILLEGLMSLRCPFLKLAMVTLKNYFGKRTKFFGRFSNLKKENKSF